ncbi:MAG TPA: hypothetical protein VK890_07250, partial [Bacteroidia bacterium]|nr:hypothetical protein [Bacteroidia bacterium]
QLNLNGNVNAVFSFNVSKHFAIPLKFGFLFAYAEADSPENGSQPSQKAMAFTPAFVGSLGLQYRL